MFTDLMTTATLADLITRTAAAIGGAPLTVGGTGLVLACAAYYFVTRAPEFLTMTAIAGVYAAVAVLPAVHV